MNLLIDTNIIVDVLRKRDFDYESARLLMALGKLHEFELWISPFQFGDLFYVLTCGGKSHLVRLVCEELTDIMQFVRVCTLGDSDARLAIRSGFDDLEDALVYQAAQSIRADAIITRNQKDFAQSRIPVFNSSEFFAWFEREHGVCYGEVTFS